MINIEYSFDDEHFLKIEGHAEATCAKHIVCAAVSALCDTLALCVRQSDCCSLTLDNGFAEIRSTNQDLFPFFRFTLGGLTLIGAEHPENVSITKKL
ncbi:MAG: ribosomal-processing cysteine protease Prp [Clostridia bacterium]|nr:ribosomal-processing cysteine protease Prp [Clostridia bacterium]